MDIKKVHELQKEIERIQDRINAVKDKYNYYENMVEYGCKETAALKRSSMDLSRILTELRKP